MAHGVKVPKPSQYKDKVKGMGWAPDRPSIKDYKWGSANVHRLGAVNLPTKSQDRRALNLNAPVRDQGDEGSCVGHSATYAVYYLDHTDKDRRGGVRSAQQVYFDARCADGLRWQTVDSGAYIRDCMDQLRKLGAALESAWPYSRPFGKKPTASAYVSAATWRLGAHYRCDGTTRGSVVQEVKEALAAGYAVVGGITCFGSMFTSAVEDSGVIPMPKQSDSEEGGHALYFDMYDDERRLLRFQNSWSKTWGDQGYGYLPYDYAESKDLADDFWAMQAEDPATTPWVD